MHEVWLWRVLRFMALVCFLLATGVALKWVGMEHSDALIPAGLLLWCTSNGIP